MGFIIQQISSLEKVRLTDHPDFEELSRTTLLRGERFSYQLAIFPDKMGAFRVSVDSVCRDWVKLYAVRNAVMDQPAFPDTVDPDYITREPGLMPDILMPLDAQNGAVQANADRACAVWVQIDVPQEADAGEYAVSVRIRRVTEEEMTGSGKDVPAEEAVRTMQLRVLPMALPPQKLRFTQWFYADCIANAHRVEIYSEQHWALIDRYMACAADIGINMLLLPVFTPPLDTMYGVQRPCVQLVEIEKCGGTYRFGFSKLHRWIGLCKKNGIEAYEVSHLFSQWGMHFAPNIRGTENGEEKLLFGWHTPADSEDYLQFLSQLLPALVAELEAEGIREQTYFHISDEPRPAHLETYRRFAEFVRPLIGGCRRLDALSNYEFYENGLLEIPVTASNHIGPFLEHHLENQWVYYCVSQREQVSNRFLAMPSYRNRIMGLQMYRAHVKGFLQWGFNYYYSRCSGYPIDPYQTTSSDLAFPSGDPFTVYPGKDGPLLSLRALVFQEGLQDLRICCLLEQYIGREAVEKLIDAEAGMELRFDAYPKNSQYLLRLREKMTELLAGFCR